MKNNENHEKQNEKTYGRRICRRALPVRIYGVRNE